MTSELLNDLAHQTERGKRIGVHPVPGNRKKRLLLELSRPALEKQTSEDDCLERLQTDLRGDDPRPDN